jgi:hypothetical protein
MAPRDSTLGQDASAKGLGITAEDIGVSIDDGDVGEGNYDLDTGDDSGDGLGDDPGEGRRTASDDGSSDVDMGEGRPTRRARDQFGREPKQKRQEQQQPQRIPSSAEVRPDAKGNLVDARGNVVARAGKEARFYQQAANVTRQMQSFQAQAQAHVTDLTRSRDWP